MLWVLFPLNHCKIVLACWKHPSCFFWPKKMHAKMRWRAETSNIPQKIAKIHKKRAYDAYDWYAARYSMWLRPSQTLIWPANSLPKRHRRTVKLASVLRSSCFFFSLTFRDPTIWHIVMEYVGYYGIWGTMMISGIVGYSTGYGIILTCFDIFCRFFPVCQRSRLHGFSLCLGHWEILGWP